MIAHRVRVCQRLFLEGNTDKSSWQAGSQQDVLRRSPARKYQDALSRGQGRQRHLQSEAVFPRFVILPLSVPRKPSLKGPRFNPSMFNTFQLRTGIETNPNSPYQEQWLTPVEAAWVCQISDGPIGLSYVYHHPRSWGDSKGVLRSGWIFNRHFSFSWRPTGISYSHLTSTTLATTTPSSFPS